MTLFLGGIGSAYSLDRLLDRSSISHPRWVVLTLCAALFVSTVAGFAAAFMLPAKTLSAAIVFAAASLFYRRLKRYPVVKTILVAAIWTWAGAALPIERPEWTAWDWWSIGASWPLFLLLAAGCILCDFKDLELDRRQGIRSLPVMWGMTRAAAVAVVLALAAILVAFCEGRTGLCYCGILLIAAASHRSALSRPALGPLLVDAILSLPGVLILTHLI